MVGVGVGVVWVGRYWGEKCVTEVYVAVLPGEGCCVKAGDGNAVDGEFEVK